MRCHGCRLLMLAAFFAWSPMAFPQLGDPRVTDITRLSVQVNQLCSQGKYTDALALSEKELKLSEATLGPESEETAICLNDLGGMYQILGDYTNAEAMFKRGLDIREKVLGPDHQFTARSLNNLGLLYVAMGRYTNAEQLMSRALAINNHLLGSNSTASVTSLGSLGSLYRAEGDYQKARAYFQSAYDTCSFLYGTEDPKTIEKLSSLASIDAQLGNYLKAESQMQQVLVSFEKTLGPGNPATAVAVRALSRLYYEMGDYARTESCLQRALSIQEKCFGPDNPTTVDTAADLGMLYMTMGDFAKAQPLFENAARVQEQAYGTNSLNLAKTLAKLSGLYSQAGQLTKAAELAERALAIDENVLGPDHPDTALDKYNLGVIYGKEGYSSKAEAMLQSALVTEQKTLGNNHPNLAAILNGLAGICVNTGDYTKAESFLLRVAQIDEKSHTTDNQAVAIHLGNLAVNYFDLHKTNEMLLYADKAEQAQLALLENILSFTSEQQRLAYVARNDPYILFASVNDAPRMARAVLRHKAIVLDSLVEDRVIAQASENPDDRDLIKQLVVAKQQLAQFSMAPAKDLDPAGLKERSEAMGKLAQQVDGLEGTLAEKVAGYGHTRSALSCTAEEVQKKLPPRTTLLEFVRYQQYLGHHQWEPRYGVVLLAPDLEPKWVSLGDANETEKDILSYQMAIRGRAGTTEAGFSNVLERIYTRIWAPVDALLPPDTKTVVISPDALLNFISFATLLTSSNQFLAEKYTIRYVVSGRDLLRETNLSTNQDVVFFATPDYAAGGQITLPRTGLQLLPLPLMAKSTFDLIALIKTWNWPVQTFSRADATEANLNTVHSPRILHFSTHGFLLPEDIRVPERPLPGHLLQNANAASSPVMLRNPMYRNGIALAGAQVTLDAWKRGEVPPTENDGILMADEAGSLDLHGTWLVVLAACDTGIGDPRIGEGIMGLRRGFVQAGAKNLLMTLWPVLVKPSCDMMLDFYSSLHQNSDPSKALAETQRDALVKFRAQYGLLSSVIMAGAFILNSQGALP